MSATTDEPDIVKMTAAAYQEKIQKAREAGYAEGYDKGREDEADAMYCELCDERH